jgi:predicted transporter
VDRLLRQKPDLASVEVQLHAERAMKPICLVFVCFVFGIAVGAGCACSGTQTRTSDLQQTQQSVQGTWLLRSFHPTVALEAPLQAMLNAQLGQMRITIQGSQIQAQGIGVNVVRTFTVIEVIDRVATLLVSEPTGVSTRVRVELRDGMLYFWPIDAPWTGEGILQRF